MTSKTTVPSSPEILGASGALAACATPGNVAQTSAIAVKISLPAISAQL
jgi:hypothetical protein